MKQYLELLTEIKARGTRKPAARENMPGTTSLFGYQLRHDLADGFPLLTSKKLSFNNIIIELLWFLRGDTNVKYLIDNGVNIWNEDAYNFYSKLCIQWHETPVDFKVFVEKTKAGEKHPKYKFYSFGDCGLQYGHQWTNFGALPKYIVQPKRGSKITGGSKHILKSTWEQMIARCYNPDSIGFKNYGAKGVHVCDEWLDFGTFVNSVMTMEGWEEKEKNWSNWQLDKDFKGDGFRYSFDTCRWVNRETNMSSSTEKFTFYREEDRYRETTTNLRKFGRTHGISHPNLSRVISGERKSTGGFVLDKIESKYEGINQIENIVQGLRANPMSRRHIISAWNPEDLDNMALHPCHALVQFNCRPIGFYERCQLGSKMGFYPSFYHDEVTHDDLDERGVPKYYLDCQMYQRSADVFLGVPYNIASYSLLTHIFAKICNMVPGEYIHTFGDVHIYDNHMDQVDEQLTREPRPLPRLWFPQEADWNYISNHLDFSSLSASDFKLEGYDPHPRIKAKLSTGLK